MKKSKKNKVNYNFPKETCELIAERDGNECLFCKLGYHMDKCRSEMLLGIPDIMHYINKSQGGLGIEKNGVLGCRYHHGLLDNGNLGLRPEMLEIMKEHLMQQYPDWSEDGLVYRKWDFQLLNNISRNCQQKISGSVAGASGRKENYETAK